jgi:hypothetical protein
MDGWIAMEIAGSSPLVTMGYVIRRFQRTLLVNSKTLSYSGDLVGDRLERVPCTGAAHFLLSFS